MPPPIRQQTTDLTITVPTLRALGQPIAPNFIGLSLELFGVHYYLNSKVATLLRELRSLTPGAQPGPVLRIGGGSADASCFVDAGPMPSGCGHRITRADLAEYAAFAAREPDLNLSYVIDVNFGRSPSPDLAVAHVKALRETSGLWPLVKAIEIGNEQDHYARLTPQEQRSGGAAHRSMTYHYEEYATEFAAYIAALRGAGLPKRRIQGGTWCCAPNRMDQGARVACAGGFLGNVSNYLKRFASELLSFSYHRYPTNHCAGGQVTPSELLADHASIGMAEWMAPLAASAASSRIEFVVGEGNSVACGGIPGVSDTFASALWALDFLCLLSKAGVRQFNFHGGPDVVYTPIGFGRDGSLEVRPLYYGLRLFAELTSDSSVWIDIDGIVSGRMADNKPTADPLCRHGLQTGATCCAASCGTCGGNDCGSRPGGERACCGHAISESGRQCNEVNAPCVLDTSFQASPIAQHATRDAHGRVRVLVIARDTRASKTQATTVCVPARGPSAPAREAELVRLIAPSLASTHDAPIRLGGQTWRASLDGSPSGERQVERVPGVFRPGASPEAASECFQFELAPLSAVMIVVPRG